MYRYVYVYVHIYMYVSIYTSNKSFILDHVYKNKKIQ